MRYTFVYVFLAACGSSPSAPKSVGHLDAGGDVVEAALSDDVAELDAGADVVFEAAPVDASCGAPAIGEACSLDTDAGRACWMCACRDLRWDGATPFGTCWCDGTTWTWSADCP